MKGWCCTNGTNCILGNRGPLCLECDNENGYFGKYGVCSKCQETWILVIKFLSIVLFALGLLYLTVSGIKKD